MLQRMINTLLFAVRLLVVDKPANALVIVDPSTKAIVSRVQVGNGPHEVTASEDGKLAIVANYGDGPTPGSTLSIVDVASGKELKRASVAPLMRPHGLAATGHHVWFTSESSMAVGRFNLETNAVDTIIGTGQMLSHMVALDRAHQTLYTGNVASGTVSKLSGPKWSATTTAVPPGGNEAIDVSPDGAQVWTAHRPNGGISVVDTATNKVIANVPSATFVFRLRFTPDGRYVVATEPEGNHLLVFDAKTRALVKAIDVPGAPVSLAVDRASSRVYVAAAMTGKVMVIDLQKLAVIEEIEIGSAPDGIALAE